LWRGGRGCPSKVRAVVSYELRGDATSIFRIGDGGAACGVVGSPGMIDNQDERPAEMPVGGEEDFEQLLAEQEAAAAARDRRAQPAASRR